MRIKATFHRGFRFERRRDWSVSTATHADTWQYLFVRDGDVSDDAQRAAWQAHFPGVKNLKIVVAFNEPTQSVSTPSACLNDGLVAFVEAMSPLRATLRPGKVAVEIGGLLCRPESVCGGYCKDVLEEAIARKVVLRQAQ